MTSTSNPAQSFRPIHPEFPPHNAPRVWLLTSGLTPIAIALSRYLLEHGDYIVLGVHPQEFDHPERGGELKTLLDDVRAEGGDDDDSATSVTDTPSTARSFAGSAKQRRQKRWRERVRIVELDCRLVGQCQAAVAEAVDAFGRIDVLLGCTSSAVIGSIEELGQSARALTLVQDQFESNFFSNVNMIKAVLPTMRAQRNGHLIVLSGISGHLGTPGLGVYCASQWAIEGYCDSLAFEVAPFNIKMTIVQPNIEVNILTNKVTSVPPMAAYAPDANPAPLFRDLISGLLDKISDNPPQPDFPTPASGTVTTPSVADETVSSTPQGAGSSDAGASNPASSGNASNSNSSNNNNPTYTPGELLNSSQVTALYPSLNPAMKTALITETVFALTAIGGHDNPPARHIVGHEGVNSVKEKLKTVSEELEEFVEVSVNVDI